MQQEASGPEIPRTIWNRLERAAKWDFRFIDLAKNISAWSKDPSTRCGAVIVRPDKTIVSGGFNGFPKGCNDDAALYADRELKYARVVHAEVNAILHAREPLHGYTIYTWPPGIGGTCDRCATTVIQAGITQVVHVRSENSEFAQRWREAVERAKHMYDEAGVRVYDYPYSDWLDFHETQRQI